MARSHLTLAPVLSGRDLSRRRGPLAFPTADARRRPDLVGCGNATAFAPVRVNVVINVGKVVSYCWSNWSMGLEYAGWPTVMWKEATRLRELPALRWHWRG